MELHKLLTEQQEQLKGLNIGKTISLKAAGTMLESTNVTGSGVTHVNPQLLDYIPYKEEYHTHVLDLFPKVPVSSDTIVIVNEVSPDGTVSAATAEGDAKNLVDKDDAAQVKQMQKFTAYVKISREMVADIPFMERQIRTMLMRRVKNVIALKFLQGIAGASSTYTSANLTGGTTGTLIKDCLPAIYADMQILSGYDMNLWLFDQPEYAKLFNEAGQNYLWYGLNNPVIKVCNAVDAGDIVAVDTSMFPLYVYKDMNIQIGYEDDDFTKNLVTIRCEARVNWNLTGNCLRAMYNDTVAATLAAIA